jgi:hypothetical protein
LTDKKERQIRLGQKARELLENETFQAAFADVEALFIERWKLSADATERDRCWMAVNISQNVRRALAKFMDNGKIAQADLDRILSEKAA